MKPVDLILVGGFLGAGKTSLLLKAVERLARRGMRAAIITNDQAEGLVDTRLAEVAGVPVEEVAGGCFCCRFSDFLASADRLLAATRPDVLLAEPVGSCTDISATILQPVKARHRARFRLAPYTVLVDPDRARESMQSPVEFLYRNQLAEADLVYFSKADLHQDFPVLAGGSNGALSAHTGAGVDAWLDCVLSPGAPAGTRLLDIDYQLYAEAEAALGWLNLRARIDLKTPLPPAVVVGPLLEDLDARLTAAGAQIVHLKVMSQSGAGWVRASLVGNRAEPEPEGNLDASPAPRHELSINLRALAAPEVLLREVEAAVAGMPGRVQVTDRRAFRPAPPQPEVRESHVW